MRTVRYFSWPGTSPASVSLHLLPPLLTPLLAAFQLAAAVPAVQQVYHGRDGQTRLSPPRIEGDATIDGRLDDSAWKRAAMLTGFSLYAPADGRPAPDSTEVLVWYSASAMYFGIRAFEPHGSVTYSLAERDRIGSDDNVEIHLDTFDEHNRAIVFAVNPLGVQADGTKSEGGGFTPGSNMGPGGNDLNADFVWQSKGIVTEDGYQVEVRIPFRSLRYRVAAAQTWGLQIDRRVQHSGYEETWTPAMRASASFIAQAGQLTGLTGMHHGQVFEFNPEATNTVSGTACCGTTPRSWKYTSDPQLGGNVRWAMGSNLVLNGTVKPDFSQVEADATQIAADERFALFYAEKRPFFVEGSDQFSVPNSLVHTRTIVRPDGAIKLTGKVGNADVAVLSALDEAQTSPDRHRPLVDIVRLRQSIGRQSQAGLLYSERVGGGRENRVVGGDTRIVFGGKYFAQFQAVQAITRENGSGRSGPLWEAVVDGTGRSYGFHYSLLGIDPDFSADNGFVPRTGFVQPSLSNRYTWFGTPGSLLEQFNTFLMLNGIWQYDDFFDAKSLLEDRASVRMGLTLRGGWSVSVSPKVATFAFDPAEYATVYAPIVGGGSSAFTPSDRITSTTTAFSLSTPQFQTFRASIGTTVGTDVDFLETSRVRRVDYNASVDLRPSARLRVNATYQSSALTRRLDDQRTTFVRIPRLKVEYQIARPIFVRVVSQYTAAFRDALHDPRTGAVLLEGTPGSLAPSTSTASNALRTDWLFSYRPTPGTVLFFGYGGSMDEPDPLAFRDLTRVADSFFMKVSYVFR